MSYSFRIKADTKGDAGDQVAAELGKTVELQPIHATDRQATQNAAAAFIDVLRDPEPGEQIVLTVTGSVAWTGADVLTGVSIHAASVSIAAAIVPKD